METFCTLLALYAGNSPVNGEFPAQRPVTWSFDVFCSRRNGSVNNREAGDLRSHRAHYDVTVMINNCWGISPCHCPNYIICCNTWVIICSKIRFILKLLLWLDRIYQYIAGKKHGMSADSCRSCWCLPLTCSLSWGHHRDHYHDAYILVKWL